MMHKKLLDWYQINQRVLPWRDTKNPYIIWLSEIILQQTRVQQGLPYFLDFVQTYPQIEKLALADEDEVLKHWQGLGYYSRARNMHHTAKLIVREYNGVFPCKYSELIRLKGIGPYTAAAIASFASNEAVAVLDGNVFRVLSRIYAQNEPINSTSGKKVFEELAYKFLNKKDPAGHNQAIMELGSLVCTPTNPICENCPLNNNCLSYSIGNQKELPVKLAKKSVQTIYFNYFLFKHTNETALIKRPKGGIWQNLYDLPLIESVSVLENDELCEILKERKWLNSNGNLKFIFETKHLLTHRKIIAKFYEITIDYKLELNIGENWVSEEKLKTLAIPRLLDKFINQLKTSAL